MIFVPKPRSGKLAGQQQKALIVLPYYLANDKNFKTGGAICTHDRTGKRCLDAALSYAANGWHVFPVPPNTKQSYKSATHNNGAAWGMTKDADEIRRDWEHWPNANVGIATGAVSGIVVIETDTIAGHAVDGTASLRKLEAEHDGLPLTLKAISPSGSVHGYFKHPGDGIKIKTSASEIGPGIDVRGDGGMVLAPPSRKPDGRIYRWLNRLPIAPMPEWLVELTQQKKFKYIPPPRSPITFRPSLAYGTAALEREIEAVVNSAPGSRNAVLNRASFRLHQLVAGGELSGSEVERRLIEAATANGLVAEDGLQSVSTTIRSGARAGLQHPRMRRAS